MCGSRLRPLPRRGRRRCGIPCCPRFLSLPRPRGGQIGLGGVTAARLPAPPTLPTHQQAAAPARPPPRVCPADVARPRLRGRLHRRVRGRPCLLHRASGGSRVRGRRRCVMCLLRGRLHRATRGRPCLLHRASVSLRGSLHCATASGRPCHMADSLHRASGGSPVPPCALGRVCPMCGSRL